MRGIWYLTLGLVAVVAITYVEQLPVLGWLGGVVTVGVWVWLGREIAYDPIDLVDGGGRLAWAGVIGGVTGLVGAVTAWLAQTGNLIGLATPPGDRLGAAFGFVGATLGIAYWPLVGAGVCAVAALAALRRAPPAARGWSRGI